MKVAFPQHGFFWPQRVPPRSQYGRFDTSTSPPVEQLHESQTTVIGMRPKPASND